MFSLIRKKEPCVGIALSGGSARGYAHVGVLRALLENDIIPQVISGTSMGSLVGLLFSAGYSPTEIQNMINKEPLVKMVKIALGKSGFFELKGLRKLLVEVIEVDDFSSLKKPYYLSVANMNLGINEVKSSGPVIEFVLASCSVPVIFSPIEINGVTYVDGGLFDNLPAGSIREKCEFLIGVNVNPVKQVNKFHGIKEIAERSFSLGIDQNVRVSKEICDFVIEPPDLGNFSGFDFEKVDKIINVGYNYTIELLREGKLKVS